MQPKSKPFVIRDEIHGDMVFDDLLKSVIDHAYFQRLRYIKQLGLAEYVFPCANHSRFQHSLGASFLAGQYFESMIQSWLNTSLELENTEKETRIFVRKTQECIATVESHQESRLYWWHVVSLAALLHDVGHGPWSHTFENLRFRQDFKEDTALIGGVVGDYLKSIKKFWHEDISVIYAFHMLGDLARERVVSGAQKYFLPMAPLVNSRLLKGDLQPKIEEELEALFKRHGIRGGVEFHRLLRPIISGPFDVDRMDYIQRDGRNCGVHIGGIEWRRIVSKVIPCLAEYAGGKNEPKDVVLISSIKNQHVLDDFIFSLFQMYAQVYLHPKIIGMEEAIKAELTGSAASQKRFVVSFEVHCSLTDEKLREIFRTEFAIERVDQILLRNPGADFDVLSLPRETDIQKLLTKHGYRLIESLDRPMMKDSIGVFLHASSRSASEPSAEIGFLRPWAGVSPIAQHFYSINYTPAIWMRRSGEGK